MPKVRLSWQARGALALSGLLIAGAVAGVRVQAVAQQGEVVKVWDVPQIGWSRGKDYYPIACLEAALFGMDKFVSYEKLMVASGAAFRAAWRPGAYDAGSKYFYQHHPIVTGAPAGARAQVVTAPDEDGAWEIITASIDRGAPVISWAETGNQVICGYDPETGSILCRNYTTDAEDYVELPLSAAKVANYGLLPGVVGRQAPEPRGQPPAFELWVLHDEGEPPVEFDWPVILTRALNMSEWPEHQRLHSPYVCGLAAYRAWADTMRNPKAHTRVPLAGEQTVSMAESFAEARDAAAKVLEEHAYVHNAFSEAAEAYRNEAAELRGMQWLLCRNQTAPWAERKAAFNENIADEAIREQAAALAERALEHEQSALAALERALKDLAPPDEPNGEVEEAPPAAEETPTEAAPADEPAEAETEQEETEPAGPTADQLVAEGMAAKRNGDLDGAAGKFREAIQLDAEHVEAHWGLAWTLVEQTERQEAIEHFRRVVELTEEETRKRQARAAIERLQSE